MSSPESQDPIMYLDIDGVLFPYELMEIPSIYEGGRPELINKSREYVSSEIIKAIASLAIETVVASSRQSAFLNSDSPYSYITQGLGIKRALHIDNVDSANILLKRDAILKDQARQPRPFVWVDDHIPGLGTAAINELLDHHQSLLVMPEGNTGLTLDEIAKIQEFIIVHKS